MTFPSKPHIPIIDGDILCYEIGFACEVGWKAINEGEDVGPPPFEYCQELLDNRIKQICFESTQQESCTPVIFLTGKGNFREEISKKKKYKGNRKDNKPFHYKNISAYLQGAYNASVIDGMEADDAMSIFLTERKEEAILCTRDKDLRQVPGWHYGWELGRQPSFGPFFVTDPGYLVYNKDKKSLSGTGIIWFYAQCIMGDPTDNIPGIPKVGPVKVYSVLKDCHTEKEMFDVVLNLFKSYYGDMARQEMLEQARLVWMVRELDKDGNPVMWEFPE